MRAGRTNILTIQTPEGLVFSLPLAGIVSRFLAYAVDLACIGALTFVMGWAVSFFALISPDLMIMMFILGQYVLWVGYGIALEWLWRGRTIGKRILRLRVMDEDGLNLRFSQIVIRNLLRFVDMLPLFYLLGGAVCVLSKRSQRLGDLAASTIVIRVGRSVKPDLGQLLEAGKYNSFREYPHLEARLRQRVSPDLADVALSALLRRDTLEAKARLELFGDVAAELRSCVEFPQHVSEGVSDEQYVRNAVETLYRPAVGTQAAEGAGRAK